MKTNSQKIIVRMAPSPTGFLHIGTVRAALFNYLFARQRGGTYILRLEDTDKERSKKEYEADLLEGFAWLGLSHDAFYRQSERTEIYKKYLEQLLAADKAYISDEEKDGKPSSVIRFRNPNKVVAFDDIIRGTVSVDTTDLGDFVLAKDVETPLFHLANVVDDFEMGVTHVIRGEDHISNTPRQILIGEAIGAPRMFYAHLPLILGQDRSKLSKRRHGKEVSVTEYKRQGYLPEAFINFCALMGWSPQSQGEGEASDILTLDELIKRFSLEKVQKSGAVFNIEKLKSLNKAHMLGLVADALKKGVFDFMPPRLKQAIEAAPDVFERALPTIIERIQVFGDVTVLGDEGEFDAFFSAPRYPEPKLLLPKGETEPAKTAQRLERVRELIRPLSPDEYADAAVKEIIWPYAEAEGRGAVLWPLRFALSGRDKSPDPFTIIGIIGRDRTLARIDAAIETLKNVSV